MNQSTNPARIAEILHLIAEMIESGYLTNTKSTVAIETLSGGKEYGLLTLTWEELVCPDESPSAC
jgi:hypothetical protein